MQLDASVQDIYSGLSELSESIVSLTVLSECSGLHEHYSTALDSFCHKTLYAVSSLFAARRIELALSVLSTV